jgi:formylglycine-generating enzyme required for sulfatase activity
MMTHEVSVAAYASFAATQGSRLPTQPSWWGASASHPVINVTWDEAQAFCLAEGGRLPTADEWQFASAIEDAIDGLPPWGDAERREANLLGTRGSDRWEFSSPVGSFRPNRFGLFDMTGNVWEWTTTEHERSNPSYDVRVILGGSWDTPARSFPRRTGLSRHGRHNLYVGFRCAG